MSGNTLGCVIGLENSSNDNARGKVFMVNGDFGVSLGVGVSDAVDFVCEVVRVATEFGTS
jgi:hypothetical protein